MFKMLIVKDLYTQNYYNKYFRRSSAMSSDYYYESRLDIASCGIVEDEHSYKPEIVLTTHNNIVKMLK